MQTTNKQTNRETKHPFIITERPLLLYQLRPHLCFFPPASGVQFIKTLSVRTTPSPSASWKHPHKASLHEPSPKSHKPSPHPVSPLSHLRTGPSPTPTGPQSECSHSPCKGPETRLIQLQCAPGGLGLGATNGNRRAWTRREESKACGNWQALVSAPARWAEAPRQLLKDPAC